MRLLLDTHTVLWQLSGERELSHAAQTAISRADDLLISAVSFAEIGIKAATGKLRLPEGLADRIASSGARTLGLSATHGLAVADLPVHHRDPFDRLLIAQAAVERLSVVTADQRFARYDIDVIEA